MILEPFTKFSSMDSPLWSSVQSGLLHLIPVYYTTFFDVFGPYDLVIQGCSSVFLIAFELCLNTILTGRYS